MCVTRSLCRNKRIFGFETNWLNCFSESKRFRRWLGHGYLRETAATDLDVRIAGLGALWQAVMLGFAGLDQGGWILERPVRGALHRRQDRGGDAGEGRADGDADRSSTRKLTAGATLQVSL